MAESKLSRDTSFFDRVKELVSLEDYLREHCDVEFVSDGGSRLAARCPFHEERTPSFKVWESAEHAWQVWRCYGACSASEISGGTVIDAVMKREGFEEAMDAARWLNETYSLGLEINTEAYERFNEMRKQARARIERSQEALAGDDRAAKAAREYLARRGFDEETAAHFGLGVDTELSKVGRLSIPLTDSENHPVSTDGRALFDRYACRACGAQVTAKEMFERRFEARKAEQQGEEPFEWASCPRCGAPDAQARLKWLADQHPKYRFERGLDKSRLLYHEFHSKRALVRDGREPLARRKLHGLYLVEGYPDCWAIWQAGQHAVCAYSGSVLSDYQARHAVEVASKSGPEPKPIILVPDMDATGRINVARNIDKLRGVDSAIEIQVLFGIDDFRYLDEEGMERPCKDIGEVLQHHGTEAVVRLLVGGRRSAEEWLIRDVLDAKLADGTPFHSRQRQMELVAGILKGVRHRVAFDHLIPYVGERWDIHEREVRSFFQANHSSSVGISHQHLLATIEEAAEDALVFLRDTDVIPFGIAPVDRMLPRGGVRRGWLAMVLGKSGTGKAQPLDAKVLTPTGWRTIGSLAVGDELVDPGGGTARVVGVFPQGEREIWEVATADGRSARCDLEHLWAVQSAPDAAGFEVITLAEALERVAAGEPIYLPTYAEGAASLADLRVVRLAQATPVGVASARCIALDSESQLYVTDGGLVTHNTMLSTQLLSNMAEQSNVRSIFFSLEQQKGSLYQRIASQVLGIPPSEVERTILASDPSNEAVEEKVRAQAQADLAKIASLFRNMIIVDNVPRDADSHVEMTPERIEAIIREINMTRFRGAPADVVVIDHLGILKPGEAAPRNVRDDELQAAGFIMERLFHVVKHTGVFMLVLQQLPKEVPPGIWFAKDAGRGGSKQTDYCDLIFGAYRPEQEAGISEDERAARRGQYKLALLKNRHGGEGIAHLMFDSHTLRITSAANQLMPSEDISDTPRVALPDFEEPDEAAAELTAIPGAAVERSEKARALVAGLEEDSSDALETEALARELGPAREEPEPDSQFSAAERR